MAFVVGLFASSGLNSNYDMCLLTTPRSSCAQRLCGLSHSKGRDTQMMAERPSSRPREPNEAATGPLPNLPAKNEVADGLATPPSQAKQEDAVTARVRAELAADGISLDDLLDAGKTVKLARELDKLQAELAALPPNTNQLVRESKQTRVEALRKDLSRVRRQVMQPLLKRVFLAQAMLFAVAGGLLSSNVVPGIDVPLVGRALGFWTVWLFTIPALRARKGTARWEKSALNIAFVTTPFVNVSLPFITRQCGFIWAADIAVLLACYAYYFRKAVDMVNYETEMEQAKIKGVLKYLDWGSWR